MAASMVYITLFCLTRLISENEANSSVPKSLEELDLLKKPLNFYITANAVHAEVKNGTKNVEGLKVFYLEVFPPFKIKYRGDVLYLHGAAFSSRIWNVDRPSIMQMTAAAGYHTVAIDLPGFSSSRTIGTVPIEKEKFIEEVLKAFDLSKPILISPSASGSYAIPFILKNQENLSGFVAVAPCCTREADWVHFKVPTLLLYGSEDKSSVSKKLLKIPTKNLCIIPDAPHAAYTRKPMEFMTALVNFFAFIHPR